MLSKKLWNIYVYILDYIHYYRLYTYHLAQILLKIFVYFQMWMNAPRPLSTDVSSCARTKMEVTTVAAVLASYWTVTTEHVKVYILLSDYQYFQSKTVRLFVASAPLYFLIMCDAEILVLAFLLIRPSRPQWFLSRVQETQVTHLFCFCFLI